MTIDEAIIKLNDLRAKSKLGGGTVLCICLDDIEYFPVDDFKVENDQHGALALVCGTLPNYAMSNEELAS